MKRTRFSVEQITGVPAKWSASSRPERPHGASSARPCSAPRPDLLGGTAAADAEA